MILLYVISIVGFFHVSRFFVVEQTLLEFDFVISSKVLFILKISSKSMAHDERKLQLIYMSIAMVKIIFLLEKKVVHFGLKSDKFDD